MFKGKVHLYKNMDGKEVEIKKTFNSEKEFNTFIDKNPELKKFQEFKWERVKWPSLSSFKDLFDDTKILGDTNFLKQMEKDFEKMDKEIESLFKQSTKLLKK